MLISASLESFGISRSPPSKFPLLTYHSTILVWEFWNLKNNGKQCQFLLFFSLELFFLIFVTIYFPSRSVIVFLGNRRDCECIFLFLSLEFSSFLAFQPQSRSEDSQNTSTGACNCFITERQYIRGPENVRKSQVLYCSIRCNDPTTSVIFTRRLSSTAEDKSTMALMPLTTNWWGTRNMGWLLFLCHTYELTRTI